MWRFGVDMHTFILLHMGRVTSLSGAIDIKPRRDSSWPRDACSEMSDLLLKPSPHCKRPKVPSAASGAQRKRASRAEEEKREEKRRSAGCLQ